MRDQCELDVRMVRVGDQRLRVGVKHGRGGGPPLIAFNGLGAALEMLGPLACALEGVEVVLFDVPGMGASPLPRHPYGFAALARLADALLDELGYRGPVDALGVSWGGALAQQFARSCPERCRRLILAATCAGAMMLPASWTALAQLAVPPDRVHGDTRTGACGELLEVAMPDPIGYLYQQLAMCGWTSLRWLALLRQPTLVLAGTHDRLIHPLNARLLASLIPDSELRFVDDGHLFVVTSARSVAPVVERFLDAPLKHCPLPSPAPAPKRSAAAPRASRRVHVRARGRARAAARSGTAARSTTAAAA
jgi:poly(3-hydroxyalkanoate) depolymerase